MGQIQKFLPRERKISYTEITAINLGNQSSEISPLYDGTIPRPNISL